MQLINQFSRFFIDNQPFCRNFPHFLKYLQSNPSFLGLIRRILLHFAVFYGFRVLLGVIMDYTLPMWDYLTDLKQVDVVRTPTTSISAPLSFASALTQLRSVFHSLLTTFRSSFLGKTSLDILPMTSMRGWRCQPTVYSRFHSSIISLRLYCTELEVMMLVREAVGNLCECVVRELRVLGVTRSGLAWIRDAFMMLEDVGKTFQGLVYGFIPKEMDVQSVFLLVFYEKIERDRNYLRLVDLAGQDTRILEREILEMRVTLSKLASTYHQPKPFKVHPPSTPPPNPTPPTSTPQTMSLDDLVQYINKPADLKAQSQKPSNPPVSQKITQVTDRGGVDGSTEEIRRFRNRLEQAVGRERRLKPTLSEGWLQRLQSRLPTLA